MNMVLNVTPVEALSVCKDYEKSSSNGVSLLTYTVRVVVNTDLVIC